MSVLGSGQVLNETLAILGSKHAGERRQARRSEVWVQAQDVKCLGRPLAFACPEREFEATDGRNVLRSRQMLLAAPQPLGRSVELLLPTFDAFRHLVKGKGKTVELENTQAGACADVPIARSPMFSRAKQAPEGPV